MTDWSITEIVFIPPRPLVRCPHCGCEAKTIVRVMEPETDGSQTRRCVCKRCSNPYRLVEDPDLCQVWQNEVDTPVS